MVAIPASELFQNQIKMRRTTISNFRQFLLALLLPAVAVATGLQACNDEGPGIPAEENGPAKSSGNPLKELLIRNISNNWSMGGENNGWVNQNVLTVGNYTFYNLEYVRIY